MADKKVSELTEATEVSAADLFVMEQGGEAKSVTGAVMAAAFGGSGSASVDNTLTVSGAAADAKVVGDIMQVLAKDIDAVAEDVTDLSAKVASADYTNWASGSFAVTMEDGTAYTGTVAFDSNSNPASITLNGHTLYVTIPA